MIKGAIFDLDDTLYNFKNVEKLAMEALCHYTCEKIGIDRYTFYEKFSEGKIVTKSLLHNCAAEHNRILYCQNMLELLGVNPTAYALDMYEVYWGTVLRYMRLNDGVLELFEYLKRHGCKIAICTDLTTHIQYRKIHVLDIGKYLDCIVTSEEVGEEKPSLKNFRLALKKLDVKPQESFFVGDNFEKDIIGASKAGIRPVWYNQYSDNSSISAFEYLNIKTFRDERLFSL